MRSAPFGPPHLPRLDAHSPTHIQAPHPACDRQEAALAAEADALTRADELAQELPAEFAGFDDEADRDRRLERLQVVLGQLSPKCQAAVVLQYWHGLSYAEIGERLGVSPNMVKKYLSQALLHCRKRMQSLG